jgi:general secretion pathway protein G
MMNNIQNPPVNAPRLSRRPLRSLQPHGFTLFEIMLVLAIIVVLLGAAIYYTSGQLDFAGETRVRADIVNFTTQLKLYEMDNNFMPTTEQGLNALYQEPTTPPKPQRWRQLMTEIPLDPWHKPYIYRNPGIHNPNGFDLYSYGPAKQENDKEIGNWKTDNNK